MNLSLCRLLPFKSTALVYKCTGINCLCTSSGLGMEAGLIDICRVAPCHTPFRELGSALRGALRVLNRNPCNTKSLLRDHPRLHLLQLSCNEAC